MRATHLGFFGLRSLDVRPMGIGAAAALPLVRDLLGLSRVRDRGLVALGAALGHKHAVDNYHT